MRQQPEENHGALINISQEWRQDFQRGVVILKVREAMEIFSVPG